MEMFARMNTNTVTSQLRQATTQNPILHGKHMIIMAVVMFGIHSPTKQRVVPARPDQTAVSASTRPLPRTPLLAILGSLIILSTSTVFSISLISSLCCVQSECLKIECECLARNSKTVNGVASRTHTTFSDRRRRRSRS